MNTPDALIKMTDIELLDEYDRIRNQVSYYNAAEGVNYGAEETKRTVAKQYLTLVKSVVEARKLTPNEGQFLI